MSREIMFLRCKVFKEISRKIYFALIRAYKRYYFGIWIVKLPFYNITSNKDKMKKWEQNANERYISLCSMIKLFNEFRKLIPQIKIWIKSKEFKKKYIDINFPYPPLLNPNSIPYKSISAKLAWELNLPLPSNYDFMYFSNGSSASAAMLRFLNECKINVKDFYGSKDIFCGYFDMLSKTTSNKNCLFFYSAFVLQLYNFNSNAMHLLCSFSKTTPLLFIARDPIEKFQHIMNHIEDYSEIGAFPKTINLTYNNILPKYTYVGGNFAPSLDALNDDNLILQSVLLDSLLNTLKDKITSIHCIEFNDLKPDKAFDTFCKLADTLGFEKPTNKEIFTNRVNRNRGALITLPTTLYAHPDDLPNAFKEGKEEKRNLDSLNKKGGFSIIVTLPHYLTESQKDFTDISDEIYPNLIIDDTKILIIIDKDELIKLKENAELFNATKIYLKGYLNALIENANKIKENLVSESQILEYLRQNDKSRKQIKNILDSELNYIKNHHPDFIQKWKYYLEFEKMCVELDGENLDRGQK